MNSIRALILGVLTIALVAIVLPTAAAHAACGDTWTGQGKWSEGGHWSTTAPPANGASACIASGKVVVENTPFPGANEKLGSLTIEAGAAVEVLIHAVVRSAATTIKPGGSLILNGTYIGNAGNASLGGGTVTNEGTVTMEGNGYCATLYGAITNVGTINVPDCDAEFGYGGNGGESSIVNTGTINIASAAGHTGNEAEIQDRGAPFTNEGGTINNNGLFYVTAGGEPQVPGSYTQGNGTETGNPVQMEGNTSLHYTGAGTSNVEVHDSIPMTGSLSAGQNLQIGIGTVVTEPSSFANAGSILLNGNYYGGGGGPAEIALSSGTFTNTGTLTAESNDEDPTLSGNFVNSGTVSIKANTQLEQVTGTFTNASEGTFAPQISSSRFGEVRIDSEASFVAGGTLAPVLLEGFVPAIGQEFDVVGIRGGSSSGAFAAVLGGFNPDYYNAGYIGAIYGAYPTSPSTSTPETGPSTTRPATSSVVTTQSGAAPPATTPIASVQEISGGAGSVSIKLSCPPGANSCSLDSIAATITEHLAHGKLTGVSAGRRTETVVIANAGVSLAAGQSKTLTLKLDGAGQTLLKRFGSLSAIVTVTSAGNTIKTATVHVHQAKKQSAKR